MKTAKGPQNRQSDLQPFSCFYVLFPYKEGL
jgi:hypothetical protein